MSRTRLVVGCIPERLGQQTVEFAEFVACQARPLRGVERLQRRGRGGETLGTFSGGANEDAAPVDGVGEAFDEPGALESVDQPGRVGRSVEQPVGYRAHRSCR